MQLIPRPSQATTSADFVVNVFVVTVATILVIAFTGTMAVYLFTNKDILKVEHEAEGKG